MGSIQRFVSTVIFFGIMIFTISTFAQAEVSLRKNGSLTVDGLLFTSTRDFHNSDHFRTHGYRCGTKPVNSDGIAKMEKSISDCTRSLTLIQNEYWPTESYQLPIWFHVITNTGGDGYVSDAAIQEQINVLNQDFRALAGTLGSNGFDVKIQFELAGITRTTNDTWYLDNDKYGYSIELQRDPAKYVNVYTNFAQGFLGYTYLPQDIASGAVSSLYDGIVLYWETVGGRNNGYGEYDQGRTLVHEMGHYLGLLHTFEGQGCFNSYSAGDLIVDTNAQDVATETCESLSSCSGSAPIHNYMDYSYDSCMWEFTREQGNRAVCSLVNFRPDIYTIVTDGGEQTPVTAPLLLPLILKDTP